jgi:hypothetical protein
MLELQEITLSEDHYSDDGYDGVENSNDSHFDMESGEWCHCSHRELEEARVLAKELAPFYRAAKYSLMVSASSAWLCAVFMFVN